LTHHCTFWFVHDLSQFHHIFSSYLPLTKLSSLIGNIVVVTLI
jgi:hypothetical protein